MPGALNMVILALAALMPVQRAVARELLNPAATVNLLASIGAAICEC